MEKFVILIKTYNRDVYRTKRLISSIKKFNRDNIPVYISIKKQDLEIFQSVLNGLDYKVGIVFDEDVQPNCNVTEGWLYQQIIKSQFWVTNISENYIAIDSEIVFLKDFYLSDFMYDDETPYVVMGERKEFLDEAYKLNKVKTQQDNKGRDMLGSRYYNAVKKIREFIPNNSNKYWDYGTGPYIWSSKVWRHFNDNYLIPNKLSFTQLALLLNQSNCMSESAIYGEYLLFSGVIPAIPISPLIKCYHWKEQKDFDDKYKISEEDIKLNYLGYALQSNWANSEEIL